jgi:fructose transport system permease protein
MVMALGGIVMTAGGRDGLPAPLAIRAAWRMALFASSTACWSPASLPPFIVTLGTLNNAFAITQLYPMRRR